MLSSAVPTTPQQYARVVVPQHQPRARAMDEMAAVRAEEPDEAPPSASEEVKEATQQPGPQQQPAVVFSVYNYGFRFMREELDVLEGIFAQNGGATPAHDDLQRIAAAMSAAPVRLAEPPHPVREKQIKVPLTRGSAPLLRTAR